MTFCDSEDDEDYKPNFEDFLNVFLLFFSNNLLNDFLNGFMFKNVILFAK